MTDEERFVALWRSFGVQMIRYNCCDKTTVYYVGDSGYGFGDGYHEVLTKEEATCPGHIGY